MQQRELLALSFDEVDNGFVFYQHRWARGIPVTSAEREAYLSIPIFGSRKGWRKALAGRATFAPRAYGPIGFAMLAMAPNNLLGGALIAGVGLGLAGAETDHLLLRLLYIALCSGSFLYAALILVARFKKKSPE